MTKLNLSKVIDYQQVNVERKVERWRKSADFYDRAMKIPADPRLFALIRNITEDLRSLFDE